MGHVDDDHDLYHHDPHAANERAALVELHEYALKKSDQAKSHSEQIVATYDLVVTIATAALYIGDSIREAAKRA